MDETTRGARDRAARSRIQASPDPITMLRAVAARAPDRAALIHLRTPEDVDPITYTYAQAADVAARFAAALVASGIRSSDSVAIIAPSVPENLLSIAAVASVAVALPLNSLLSAEALASQLRLAGTRAVIAFGPHPDIPIDTLVAEALRIAGGIDLVIELESGHGRSTALARSAARCVTWSEFIEGVDPKSARPVLGARAAALYHTGGTTGFPKLAELSLSALMAALHSSAIGFDWREDDRLLQLLPFFHVGGAHSVGLSLFSTGATLINCGLAGARDPATVSALWDIGARMRASIIVLVPATWSSVAAQGKAQRWPELRALMTGAAAMAPELVRRMSNLVGVQMTQGLGMTELCGTGANQPFDNVEREPAVGYPAPLLETKLTPISPGGPSELLVRGPMLFSGYRTAEGLVGAPGDGWYASGDLAEILPDGQLRLVGRAKDVIIRGGHNIDPLAIEDVVGRHPDIVLAAAVGMPDAVAGELPVVYAVRKSNSALSEHELAAFVAERIDEPPARPKRIIFVDALPLTAVGKVARFRLRQAATVTRLCELLGDLAEMPGVFCDDLAARRVQIVWRPSSDAAAKQAIDVAAAPLGISITHAEQ